MIYYLQTVFNLQLSNEYHSLCIRIVIMKSDLKVVENTKTCTFNHNIEDNEKLISL